MLRAHDAGLRVVLQQSLTALYPVVNGNPAEFLRQLGRLETFVRDVPAYRESWEAVKYKLARSADADAWLEQNLASRWDHGKGDYLAGEQLVTFYLDTHRDGPLARVVDEFDHRPLLPEQLLYGIEEKPWSSRITRPWSCRSRSGCTTVFRRTNSTPLQRAAILYKTGQTAPANQLFAAVAATAVLRDDLTGRVAALYLELGDKRQAQFYLEQAVRGDPLAAHSTDAFVQLARLVPGRWPGGGRGQPPPDRLPPGSVQRLHAAGGLPFCRRSVAGREATGMPLPDFPLTFAAGRNCSSRCRGGSKRMVVGQKRARSC